MPRGQHPERDFRQGENVGPRHELHIVEQLLWGEVDRVTDRNASRQRILPKADDTGNMVTGEENVSGVHAAVNDALDVSAVERRTNATDDVNDVRIRPRRPARNLIEQACSRYKLAIRDYYRAATTFDFRPLTSELEAEVRAHASGLGVEFFQWVSSWR